MSKIYYIGYSDLSTFKYKRTYTGGKYPNNGYYMSMDDILNTVKGIDVDASIPYDVQLSCTAAAHVLLTTSVSIVSSTDRFDSDKQGEYLCTIGRDSCAYIYDLDPYEVVRRFTHIKMGRVGMGAIEELMHQMKYSRCINDTKMIPGNGIEVYKKDGLVVSYRYNASYPLDVKIRVYNIDGKKPVAVEESNIFRPTKTNVVPKPKLPRMIDNDTRVYLPDLYQMSWRDKKIYCPELTDEYLLKLDSRNTACSEGSLLKFVTTIPPCSSKY